MREQDRKLTSPLTDKSKSDPADVSPNQAELKEKTQLKEMPKHGGYGG